MGGKIQNADVKSLTELTGLGATKTELLNTDKMYSPKTTNVLETDLRKNNDIATTDPAVGNDSTQNYEPGSRWLNVTTGKVFVCKSNGVGAAVWIEEINTTATQAMSNKTLTAPTINNGTATGTSLITPARSDVKQDTFANLTTYALTAANGQLVFATDTKQYFEVKDTLLKEILNVDSAQQAKNKSIETPSRLDVKQDTLANLTTYAITASNGQLCFATDSKAMYQVIDGALATIAGSGGIGGVDILAVDVFDTANVGDYVQTGLSLSIVNPLRGTKSALLTHQSAVNQSFKKVIAVDRKFRGKNLTLSLNNRSTAYPSNLTMTITDETNSTVLNSSQINTDKQAFTANTNSNTSITNIPALIMNYLAVGQAITGPGIPANTVITALNGVTFTATISNATTATAAVTLNVSGSSTTRSFSFDIPANCSSISYLVTALPEANLPETYIDDVIIQLTANIILSGSVQVPRKVGTKSWTPVFTGFGTVTNIQCEFDEDGEYYNIRAKFTIGTPTAVEAQMTLPNGANTAGVTLLPATAMVGKGGRSGAAGGPTVLAQPNVGYLNFANDAGVGDLTPLNGNGVLGTGETCSFFARVPIAGAQATTNISSSFSQVALIQVPDATLQMNNFSYAFGSTGTSIFTFGTPNYQNYSGDAIKYVRDTVLGDYFEAQRDGIYNFNISFDPSGAANAYFGLSKNSTQLSTGFASINDSDRLTYGSNTDVNSLIWGGLLKIGDRVRLHNQNAGTIGGPGYGTISISFQGSTKQINPQLNQKITIPTHQLRFEGASARGTTDTAIVKFDAQSLIKGDAFSVVNTTANGTVITINKSGKLDIQASIYTIGAANTSITKNQTVLNSYSNVIGEILSGQFVNANAEGMLSWSGDVVVGDKIRIQSTVTPSAEQGSGLKLYLQEQAFPLAISNLWQQNGAGFNADNLLLQNFDVAQLGDFTQSGLNLVITNALNGAKSAQLIHQSAINQSFKQIFQVSPKFRGKNLTLKHDIVSTSTQGNLTITVVDETNVVTLVNASQIATGSQAITATVSNTSNILTGVSNTIINALSVGMKVTGLNIPSNSYITALSAVNGTITISNAATGAGTSVRISALPSIQKVSFDVPANCGSLSYLITALPETNSPETYIDGISVDITSQALMSTAANITTTPPTVQKFLTGSGTYIAPANVSYIRVRMVGAGGGGGGNSNNGGNNKYAGATGGNTTFADMIAYGGQGGQGAVAPGGTGGLFSLGSIAKGSGFIGGAGQTSSGYNASGSSMGGSGGSSFLGGGAPGPNESSNGNAATANTGGGGSGASGIGYSAYNYGASGGGAGGAIDAVIYGPANSYSYSVGTGGAGAGGNNYSGGNGGSGYIEVTEYYTTSATLPLTTAQLVQTPDFALRVDNGGVSTGVGSTATGVRRFSTVREMNGSAVQFLDDAVNGSSFVIKEEGDYAMTFNDCTATAGYIGISKNCTTLTSPAYAIALDQSLACSYINAGGNACVSANAYLKVGDIIRAQVTPGSTTYGNQTNNFQITKLGSLKQLNPSSDAKIIIPTHELRFDGCSSRGSSATNILKYDSQVITRGDAFAVTNDASNGTVITMKKAGRLSFTGSQFTNTTGAYTVVTKNQSILTTTPLNSEMVSANGYFNATNSFMPLVGSTDVNIGDVIRVSSSVAPTATAPGNFFHLHLTETSIPANFSNVLPQWSQGDSCVRVTNVNGYGSTATGIRRWSNVPLNMGTAISYVDDAVNGSYFKINESGIYAASYTDSYTAAAQLAITVNQSNLTLGASSVPNTESLATMTTGGNSYEGFCSWNGYLNAGDIIRTSAQGTSADIAQTSFTIAKIGKPNLSSVDVTSFVNLKTIDIQNSRCPDFATTVSGTSSNIRYSTGVTSNRTDIISITDDGTNTRFTALKDCSIVFTAAGMALGINAANAIYIKLNGTVVSTGGAPATQDYVGHTTNLKMFAGDYVTVSTITTLRLAAAGFQFTAIADNAAIATPTQQVSSDTMSFVFKSTAIDPNVDPIGTFNTYTYTASSNTSTLATVAPTQSIASMNINGIQLFGRAYNAASTAASPAKIDIFIGKGLKSRQVDAYNGLLKTIPLTCDYRVYTTAIEGGTNILYNETTGILTIDPGTTDQTTVTGKYVGSASGNIGYVTSGYFVFNASKSPSLVTIPNVNPKVATIYNKTNTQASFTSAVWTNIPLNTVVDPQGIITSLASNQFTLPAGTYLLTGSMQAYNAANSVQSAAARLYDVNGAAVISEDIGSVNSYPISATYGGCVPGELVFNGTIFTITSAKTLAVQFYSGSGAWNDGSGQSAPGVTAAIREKIVLTKLK